MATDDDATGATIQDADLEADARAVGYDVADRSQEFLSTATPEAIRNFAHSYGDDNPLFCDPAYGDGTRWGGQIAPSLMAGILNAPLLGDPLPAERRGGSFRGIHVFAAAFDWEFYRPLRPGDTVYNFNRLDSSEVRDTSFAGPAVFRTQRWVKVNQDGQVLSVHRMLSILSERKASRERSRKKAGPAELASYTPADIEAIDAQYAAETRRGPDTLHWADVEVGQSLPTKLKGPFTLTDVIRFHAGGYHINDVRTSRLAWANRQKKPKFYTPNAQGVPDVAQRVHWDSSWAQQIGLPGAIDYGSMREFGLHHLLTDWIGDNGWIQSQHVELRKFVHLGDTNRLSGEVTAKRLGARGAEVDVEFRATNQRGDETANGRATVLLPTHEGPVQLCGAPVEYVADARQIMERHQELSR
jgi:acyl dehydratase